MRKAILKAAALSLCLLLTIPPHAAQAWGNTGHEAVAYLAWKQLKPATRLRVLALLKKVPPITTPSGKVVPGYDQWVADLPAGLSVANQNLYLFMRAATWADSIKHVGLVDSDIPPPDTVIDVNVGFGDTASHGYWHFIDTAFASDDETVPATPAPNAVTQIDALRKDIASDEDDLLKVYDMIWLEHLVGDIHQPLHATARYNGGKSDIGGNDVRITISADMKQYFECPPSKGYPTELHAFWDDLPGYCPATNQPKAIAYAKTLPLLIKKPTKASTKKLKITDPATWADESFKLAQKDAYANPPIGATPQPTEGTAKSYAITDGYYNQGLADAKTRISLAGARLAKLLNENLK
jgi:hypothetical protein